MYIRAGHACHSCAVAKLRCEDDKPCTRCKRKGIACVSAKATPAAQNARNRSTSTQPLEQGPFRQASYPYRGPGMTDGTLSIDVDVPSPAQPHYHHETRPHTYHGAPQAQATCPTSTGIGSASGSHAPRDAVQGSNMQSFPPNVPEVLGESSLADFLNDIMLPPLVANEEPPAVYGQSNQTHPKRDFLSFGTSWLDFLDIEALLADHDAEAGPQPDSDNSFRSLLSSGSKTPLFGQSFAPRSAAFSRSIWRWTPTKKDHYGAEQLNLSLPLADMDSPETRSVAANLLTEQHIDQNVRDRILALVLSTCNREMYSDVVSSFPSAELLNGLMHHYLNTQFSQIDSWLHVPTFAIDDQELELLISIIAAGGVVSTMPAIRKLGFALHESAREALSSKFESDNRYTRDLACIQAMALNIRTGIWSGDKRKMEIAESFLQPPATMMRRSGRFSRSRNHISPPAFEDSEETLQAKWREWAHAESYKRLAIYFLIHAAQVSMAQQGPPLVSPSEITLDLPASRDLWCASTAEAWRDIYIRSGVSTRDKACLSIAQSISNISMIRDQACVDIPLSAMIAVYCMWAPVWSHLQLNSLLRAQTPGHTASESLTITSSWDNGLSQLLDRFRLTFSDWDEFHPQMALVLERIILNMHVSFEHVQLFAGKEGEEEARRVFPLLQHWSTTSGARRAVWHAGQILKAARRCPQRHLHDFPAVCLYHAGMTFWTFAVVSASVPDQREKYGDSQISRLQPNMSNSELVWLDGDDCPVVQRFIALNRGTPVVCSNLFGESEAGNMFPTTLNNPKAIMQICIDLLKGNSSSEGGGKPLPLVENLSQLMHDLGIAAQELLRGGLTRPRGTQVPSGQ